MDPSTSSSQTNDTISDTGGNSSSSPPSFIWVIIPLVVVLLTGGLIATLYRVIIRCRWRKTEGGDSEQQTAGGLGTTTLEVEDATAWARGHNTRRDPALDTNTTSHIRNPSRNRSAAQPPAEGLNELGEAPPPYGEGDDEARPKGYMAEMDEVRGGAAAGAGEGPSGPQQGSGGGQGRRPPAGPEPPAYEESAVGGGPGGTSSLREPPAAAAVIARPR
ncbi:hypothetical protein VPNG_08608 [Cytospora leucostoma]|uniref:Uncharacterized protein n=1 Tax=Cytospora leucostoma TaxID=1230097 RepID=A0A423W464_9PEZI|nr:hypothetical protein VPNG_08608 [Cytospora leucostoma]